MSNQYTWEEIRDKINAEQDILVLLQDMMDNKTYHPEAMTNFKIRDGEAEFKFDPKGARKSIQVVCPFHSTAKHNSTDIDVAKNAFTCRTDGKCRMAKKTLSVVNLYMILRFNVLPDLLYESKDEFKEAIKELCEMNGITFDFNSRKLTDSEKKDSVKQEIREKASLLYHENFFKNNKYAREAREYLFHTRGFKYAKGVSFRQLVRKFKIGYAGGKYGSAWLYNKLSKKYSDQELLEAGVVNYEKSDGTPTGKLIDSFTRFLTMPYFSQSKINNLYGRNLKPDSDFRHYRLPGGVDIPINYDTAKRYKDIILVEGEISWLSMIAMGFENAMGNKGTGGLTDEHVRLMEYIRERTNGECMSTVYLCFDNDSAGLGGAAKTGARLVQAGFDVRVMRLTEGDPNDYLKIYKEKAGEKLQELKDLAITFEAFAAVQQVKKRQPKTDADKKAAVAAIAPLIKHIPKDQLIFIGREVADDLGINEEWLLSAWEVLDAKRKMDIPGFDKAVQKSWVFVTDNMERFEALEASGAFDNVIFAEDTAYFLSKLKMFNRKNNNPISNLAFDSSMNEENKEFMLEELVGFKFLQFSCSSLRDIENADKYTLYNMLSKFSVSVKQAG